MSRLLARLRAPFCKTFSRPSIGPFSLGLYSFCFPVHSCHVACLRGNAKVWVPNDTVYSCLCVCLFVNVCMCAVIQVILLVALYKQVCVLTACVQVLEQRAELLLTVNQNCGWLSVPLVSLPYWLTPWPFCCLSYAGTIGLVLLQFRCCGISFILILFYLNM